MIPSLYNKSGLVKIGNLADTIEAYVTEERNGEFELELIYPTNYPYTDNLIEENIIIVDANDTLKSQKFRIYMITKLMSNKIAVNARHISFDLMYDYISALSIDNQSCEYALNILFRNSQFSTQYTGISDIVNTQNFSITDTNILSAIGGSIGSILDTFGTGAEILRDNTKISVLNKRGNDNEVTIEYRKNLTGFELEEDISDLATRIQGYAKYTPEGGTETTITTGWIDSPLINNYSHPYIKRIDFSDRFQDGAIPTITNLTSLVNKKYTVDKVDIPKQNYKIEFIPLSKCGYTGVEDKISLCDKVTIIDSRYGVNTQAKVIKVVFDVLRGRYDSMELGEPKTTLGDIIGGGSSQGLTGPQGPQGLPGADGNLGDFPDSLPSIPVVSTKVYGFADIEINWTYENKVYYSYELYASKTSGFAPNTFNLIFQGHASTFLYQAVPGETWYFKVCAVNTQGNRTAFSTQVAATTTKVTDLSNYVSNASIGNALIGTLNLGRGWVGQLTGNLIDAKQLSVTDSNGKKTLWVDSSGNVQIDATSVKMSSESVATGSSVKSTIEQSPSSIKIGFNGINDYVQISPTEGLKITHRNGSYTKMNYDGLLRYVNGTNKEYKYITYITEVSLRNESSMSQSMVGTYTGSIPAEFRVSGLKGFIALNTFYAFDSIGDFGDHKMVNACFVQVSTLSVFESDWTYSFSYNITGANKSYWQLKLNLMFIG